MHEDLGLLSLLRPVNMLLGGASVAALMYYMAPLSFSWSLAGIPVVIVALTLGAGNVINDITDIETDQVNHPERFLARHPEYKPAAWIVFAVLIALILGLMFISKKISSFPLTTLGLVVGTLLVLYSIILKRYLFWNNLTVALCASAVVPFSYLWLRTEAINPQRPVFSYFLYGALIFFVHFSREIVKSMADHVGDLLRQSATYVSAGHTPLLHCILRFNTLCMGAAILIMPVIMKNVLTWYYVILMIPLGVLLLKIFRLIPELSDVCRAKRLALCQKWTMALGIVSLLCWKS